MAILLLLVSFQFIVSTKAINRALIIGIGEYSVESGWNVINGDDDIVIINELLLQNGFNSKHINIISNSKATYQNIIKAIDDLITVSSKNDVVYIHFSGHGQLITDVSGDEESGFDEAWIPYDAYKSYSEGIYEGHNHLVDDELNTKLHALRDKVGASGKIIVIADACHSGGGSRDEEDVILRGTKHSFIIPNKHVFFKSNKTEDWVYISACKSYQFNQQCLSHPYGSLSYAIYLLRDDISLLSTNDLVKKIRTIISTLVKFSQTPEVNSPAEYLELPLF
jgi:hypothetical protein